MAFTRLLPEIGVIWRGSKLIDGVPQTWSCLAPRLEAWSCCGWNGPIHKLLQTHVRDTMYTREPKMPFHRYRARSAHSYDRFTRMARTVTGSMVATIGGTAQKEPIVVGKPSAFLMKFLLNKFRCDPLKMCMVGDRLDTDIFFGKDAGCKTLLVLTD